MSRYRFIVVEKAHHAVALLCRVLRVSRSGFYAWQERGPSARVQANILLLEQIRTIHAQKHGTYGAPRMQAELRARRQRVARKRVARLMRSAALVGHCPRGFRKTTTPDASTRIPDLVHRDFSPAGPNQLWVGDITYIRTWEGWLYLAVLLDAYSRKVVGWALADHLRTELATAAFQMALTTRRPPAGLIHHTDRGSQYTGHAYSQMLAAQRLRQSVGHPGTCYDNAVAESFFATLKRELIHRHCWPTRRAARAAIFPFIEGFYNRQRRHSTLAYATPEEFEHTYLSATLAA